VERVERGALILEDIPAPAPELAAKLARYIDDRGATFRDWTPDGAMLVASREGEVEQLQLLKQPLGPRRQLTFAADPVGMAAHSPRGLEGGYVFLRDVGGNEHAQVYFSQLSEDAHSEPRVLTDGNSLAGRAIWSNDGTRIAFHSNMRGPLNQDVYIMEPAKDAAPKLVIESGGNAWYPLDWSPDDTKLLLWNYVSINDSSVHVADLVTGNRFQVDASPARIGVRSAKFSRDGRGVFLVSDRGSEFKQLRYVDLATRDARVLSGPIPWDIEAFDVSRDGHYLAYISNEDGSSRLNLVDWRAGKSLGAPNLPAGVLGNLRFDPESRRLAFSFESGREPREAFVYDLQTSALTQWTRSEPIAGAAIVEAQLFRYQSYDELGGAYSQGAAKVRRRPRQIPAFLYQPSGSGPFPVLIYIHGGPEAQYRPGYDAFIQFAVSELGYAVIAPNVRGSDGYGKTYLDLDNGFRRQDSVRDIGALLDWIARQPALDRKRVVTMGSSYGGYMTLASLVEFSDRLRGGIDVVGISNFLTFLNNTSEYRRDLRRVEYGDEREVKMRTFLANISPLMSANRIRSPLLVVQGLNDPRVPASESEQMVARVRANGGQVWYLAAKDEGHGFRRKQNRDAYWQTVASFLSQLAGDSAVNASR
jgi:dipeptidyl aminopeptidase/acylaminoacyl peptidase